MAQRGNFWTTRFGRGLGRAIDVVAKGNNFNPQTGQFSNLGKGLIGRGLQTVGTLYGGPMVGQLIGQGTTNWANTGNPIDFSGNQTRLGQLVNAFTNQNKGPIGPVERAVFATGGRVNVPDIGMSLQPVTASVSGPAAPWAGLGTSTGDLFSGGSLGNWANAPASPRIMSGGGARGAFSAGSYASPEARAASISATQQALQEAFARQSGTRQSNNYEF